MNTRSIWASLVLCSALPVTACSENDAADTLGVADGMYALDVPDTYWSDPPGIGADIGVFVPRFLFDVSGKEVTLGTAKEGVQDPCTPTAVAPANKKEQVVVGPIDYQMHLVNETNHAHVNTTIRNLTFADVLPPVGDEGGTLTAVLDAREISPIFHLLPDPKPEDVCAALDDFGAACEPCPQDNQPFCLTIAADRLEAVPAPEMTMGPVDKASLGAECASAVP